MFGTVRLHAVDAEHPNKRPFSGILTYFNAFSDRPPGGSGGRRVFIPLEVGEAALPTLVGMAVNVRTDLSGHDPTQKVGIIEKAYTGEPLEDGRVPVYVEGYLFEHDFPDLVAELVAHQDELGFSYETTETTAVDMGGSLRVTSLVFTGASILYKNRAAYQTTSFAAESEGAMDQEKLKELLAQVGFNSIEDMFAWFAEFKKSFEQDGKYAWLEVHLSAEQERDAKIAALTEKVEALEKALSELNTKLTASADNSSINVEVFAKAEDHAALKETVDSLAEQVRKLVAEAEEKAKHERKSLPGIKLLAKYAPLGEVNDLQATIKQIREDQSLSAVEKVARIMEAQYLASNKQ